MSTSLQDLMQIFKTDKGYHHHYYDFYENLMAPLRDANVRLLEIGVKGGRSMALWQEYFPKASVIVGIGYGPSFKPSSCTGRVQCFLGDQSNVTFLNEVLKDTGGSFDIIIDDGSHHPHHQYVTLQRMLQHDAIKEGGVYIVEDIETSYWRDGALIYGLTLKNTGVGNICSFVDYAKSRVDIVNREFSKLSGTPQEHRIVEIRFAQNVVALIVGTGQQILRMNRSYRFQKVMGSWYARNSNPGALECAP